MIDFDELYEKYSDMLYKIAFLYFGNKHDAEDALQEVFVKALLKITNDTDSHQKAWLIRVTQNQCKDMLKKAKNINLCIDDVIVTCEPEHINNERRIDILQKIINLPPKQKIIVILYYYYDYSVSQIASTLKISESNVKVRLKRGRDALKLELEGYDDVKSNEFKNAVDLINTDEYFQSRLKEKVTEQCAKKNKAFKKPAILGLVSVMVFAIVVAGLEINNVTVKNNDNVTSQNGISTGISRVVSGFVMIAYADDKKTYTSNIEGFEMSDFPFCKIGVSDLKNKTEEEISNIIKQKRDEFHNYNGSTKYLQSHFTCERMNNTLVYFTTFGAFDFDLNESDYSNVKEIRVSNLNPEISEMEIVAQDAMYDDNLQLKDNSIDYTNSVYITNYQKPYASVSGERFRRCMELEKTGDADFQINWKMANSLYKTIDENPDFDFTDIKDTVIFEVVYNNDAISKSVIDIAFDENGNMKITPKSFDYIVK